MGIKSKKRRLEEDIPEVCEFTALCAEIKEGKVLEKDVLKQFKSLLKKLSKDENSKEKVASIVDRQLLSSMLVSYTGLRTENDLRIYKILEKLERKFEVRMDVVSPPVFGPSSKEHYAKLTSLGSTLHRISPDQVLTYINPQTLWNTVKNHSKTDAPSIYDERFLLRLFCSIVHPGSELTCKKFIEHNCLSLVFSCTSSKTQSTRHLAYFVLQRFLSLLLELKEEKFPEKSLYIYVLRVFKQSLTTEAPRISHLISHFFARVSKLLLHPESAAYGQVLAFLCQKPQVDLNNIPEFYKLLLSSSVRFYKEEREWILLLVSEAMVDPIDYNVLQSRSGVKLLLSLFNTCMVDQQCRKLILATLKAAVSIPSAAYDLFHRCNLQSWIALTIKNSRLTRWERNYLAQIFTILLENEKAVREEKKLEDGKVSVAMARVSAKTVCSVLNDMLETEAVAGQHLATIESILGKQSNGC